MRSILEANLHAARACAAGLAVLLSLAGCTTTAVAPAHMQLGAQAAPPTGWLQYCEREPLECASKTDTGFAEPEAIRRQARRLMWAAKLEPKAEAPIVATNHDRSMSPGALGVGSAEVRHARGGVGPLETRLPPTSVVGDGSQESADASAPISPVTVTAETMTASAAPAPEEVLHATPALLAKLKAVNSRINRAIVRSSDAEIYGVEDYWATPLSAAGADASGDCEDYVLEKRRALLLEGVAAEALSMAIVITSWDEVHAVLLVSTDKGELVLDNLNPWIVSWTQTDYRWIQRERHGDAFRWAAIEPLVP